jgi:type IV pilus assembly protein PilP
MPAWRQLNRALDLPAAGSALVERPVAVWPTGCIIGRRRFMVIVTVAFWMLHMTVVFGGEWTQLAQTFTVTPGPAPAPVNSTEPVPTSGVQPASEPAPGQPGQGANVARGNPAGSVMAVTPTEYGYNPSGRRDPFAAIVKDGQPSAEDHSLPPLQRIALTELNLIGIIWGGFGYNAMVQTPDGKGYTVRTGTRIGPNSGVVSSITENSIVVQERYTDVYGNKQVREYLKLLHPKEGSE